MQRATTLDGIKALSSTLPKLYETEKIEKVFRYKITISVLDWVWYPVEHSEEIDEDDNPLNLYFGLVVGYEAELGQFSLQELAPFHPVMEEIEPITQEEIEKKR